MSSRNMQRRHRKGSRRIALSMLIVGTRGALVFNATPRPLYSRKRAPVPVVQYPRWAAGSVWTRVEMRKISCSHRSSNPVTFSLQRVVVSTSFPWPAVR